MSDLTSLKNRWDASAKMRDMSLASDLVKAFESHITELESKLADLEKRNQNITDAMTRWGWSHCTTEKELIEQIDFILAQRDIYKENARTWLGICVKGKSKLS